MLPSRGEPEALLQRLGQAWQAACQIPADEPRTAHLLASLVRDQRDLLPLAAPQLLRPAAAFRFRHRLRCLCGERLPRLRSWEWCHAESRWRSCGMELPLATVLLDTPRLHGPQASAHGTCPGSRWTPLAPPMAAPVHPEPLPWEPRGSSKGCCFTSEP